MLAMDEPKFLTLGDMPHHPEEWGIAEGDGLPFDPARWAEERQLTGTEINSLLPTIVARGNDTTQRFYKSGLTEYVASGRPSTGKWWVTATQYCSTWPPSASPECYDVFLDDASDPATLVWVDKWGNRTLDRITQREAGQ